MSRVRDYLCVLFLISYVAVAALVAISLFTQRIIHYREQLDGVVNKLPIKTHEARNEECRSRLSRCFGFTFLYSMDKKNSILFIAKLFLSMD